MRRYDPLLLLALLLISSLACQAVMKFVSPASTGLPERVVAAASSTPTPLLPPEQASCPLETKSVLQAANSERLPLGRFPSVDPGANIDVPLVKYSVNGDTLSAPALADVPPELQPYQQQFDVQRSAWDLFRTLIPGDQRRMLVEFQIITDGPGGVLSAVEQSSGNPDQWILETDIADVPDRKNLTFTLLHEFGHLLTLNSSQVPPDLQVFNNPDSTHVYDRAVAACPNYFPGEGCSLPASYVNAFFKRFWTDLYNEWSSIDRIDDDGRREARLRVFYRHYKGRFVDSYAVTSPAEDIAETWGYFVLSAHPSGTTQADQKVSFFYDYPELVKLRGAILASLCALKP